MKNLNMCLTGLLCAVVLSWILFSASTRHKRQLQNTPAPNEVRSEIVKELERGEEVQDRIMEILLKL